MNKRINKEYGKKQVCYMFDFGSACCEARRLFLYAKAGKNETFCSGKKNFSLKLKQHQVM